MVFGGAGLVLYVIAWLLIPAEGHEHSAVENVLRAIVSRPGVWLLLVFAAVVLFVLIPMSYSGGYALDLPPTLFWAVAVLVIGVLLLRRDGSEAARIQPTQAVASAPAEATVAQPAPPVAPPKPRGPLGWYTLAAIFITVGVVAAIQNVAVLEILPGQYFGIALLLLGIGLAIGSWWGSARPLILLGILLLPLGVVASFVTAPLEGGLGDQTFIPQQAQQVRSEYRMTGGQLTLDLSQLRAGTQIEPIAASVALGQLNVIVPSNASVDATVEIGGGAVGFFGEWEGGANVTNRYQHPGSGPAFVLALEAGIGEIRIMSVDERGRCIGCDCSWMGSCGYPLNEEEGY
jgi:hypothetical protein